MRLGARLIAGLSASACAGAILAALFLPAAMLATSPGSIALAQGPDPTLICRGESTDVSFYSEIAAVNARMHEAMEVVPVGDVDRDFTRMMIPHHQGAIDMARVLLKYGRDEKLKRLAQSIIVEQSQEIAYMRTLLDPPDQRPSEPIAHQ